MSKQQPKPSKNFPNSISEAYELVKQVLLSDDEKLINKMWKFLNEAPGDWVWVRTKLMVDCYESADATGREEFCQLALDEHIKRGSALPLAEIFVDPETEIEYLEYLMADRTIYRVPIATPDMDKYTFQKALEKKFLGDFLEIHSSEDVEYTLLDTREKVESYNTGTYFEKFVYGKKQKK
jgi:hypothetical protein